MVPVLTAPFIALVVAPLAAVIGIIIFFFRNCRCCGRGCAGAGTAAGNHGNIENIIFADFFLRRKGYDYDAGTWNWTATIAMAAGGVVGILTAYVTTIGIPAVQTLLVSYVIYYFAMKAKLQKAA